LCHAVLGLHRGVCAVVQIAKEAEVAAPRAVTLHGSSSKARQLLLVTDCVHEAAARLANVAGSALTLGGQPYPPAAALQKAALAEFCARMQARVAEVEHEGTG